MSYHVADGANLSLTTPGGDSPLSFVDGTLTDPDGDTYYRSDGIWRMIRGPRYDEVEAFALAYSRVRHAEGRGSDDSAYYRELPYKDLSGRLSDQWASRARSYDRFLDTVVRDRVPGVLVDVGAGNCWLSARMAAQGWSVLATDVNSDSIDGLEACRRYDEDFCAAQVGMEALPLATGTADLVVFNSSLHYASCVGETLAEAVRVLNPGGALVVMDSPVFTDQGSGEQMVAETATRLARELGVPAAPLAGPGFIAEADLACAISTLGVEWLRVDDGTDPALIGSLRRRVSRARAGRELARLPLLVGTFNREATA